MRTVEEIFADVSAHQIKGIMIHSQLADYYRFLGLDKYADCHEHHYKSECCSWRKITHYYIEHYNKLIPEKRIDNPDVIPSDWYRVSRGDVDAQTKRRAVERGMEAWVKWETDTKDLYEKAFSEMLSLGEGAGAMRIKKCLCAVDDELAEAYGYWLKKKDMNYDIGYIVGEQ